MSTPDYAQQLADKAARLQTLFTEELVIARNE